MHSQTTSYVGGTFLEVVRAAWCRRLSSSLGGRLLIVDADKYFAGDDAPAPCRSIWHLPLRSREKVTRDGALRNSALRRASVVRRPCSGLPPRSKGGPNGVFPVQCLRPHGTWVSACCAACSSGDLGRRVGTRGGAACALRGVQTRAPCRQQRSQTRGSADGLNAGGRRPRYM